MNSLLIKADYSIIGILLIFKLYIYNSREKHVLNINTLPKNIAKIKKIAVIYNK